MKNLKQVITTFLLMFALTGIAVSQQYEFKVMAFKGKTLVQKQGSHKWERIRLGSEIFANQKIKLPEKAYLSLVYRSGRTIELKKSGIYAVKNLAKGIKSGSSGITKRFTNYVMSQINSASGIVSGGNYRDNMQITGSVNRGWENLQGQGFVDSNPFKLNSPRKVNFINDIFTFRWLPYENTKDYKFILTDRFDRPVFSKTVHSTSITLNANELKLDKDTYYFWKVEAMNKKNTKSNDACFMVYSPQKVKAIQDTVSMIKKQVGGDKSASAQVVLAAFYEQNYIIEQALKSYREAVTLAPDVSIYSTLYKRFLNRLDLQER